MNPFQYRPNDSEDLDWEDNWLSNSMAFVSDKVFPKLCKDGSQYIVRFTNYIWTSCPCCLFVRGAIFGAMAISFPIAILAAAIYVFM